jgi:hypothetical protein
MKLRTAAELAEQKIIETMAYYASLDPLGTVTHE